MKKYIWQTLVCALFCGTLTFGATGCDKSKECSVTFDHNDGSGNVTVVKIPKGESIEEYAPVFIDGNQTIASWQTLEGKPFSGKVKKSIHLVGVWKDFEETVTKNIPATVTEEFVRFDVANSDYVCESNTITIASSVKRLSIVSASGTTLPSWNIVVADRKRDLYMELKDVSIAPNACAIDAVNKETTIPYTLHINVEGNNVLNCSRAINATEAVDGIRAHHLRVRGKTSDPAGGNLLVIGGYGSSGSSGWNGSEGENGESAKSSGTNGGSGIVADSVYVEDCIFGATGGCGGRGGNGGNGNNSDGLFGSKHRSGGNGSSGGNGGAAITTNSFTAKNAALVLAGGYGGDGGYGGNGGGSSSVFAGNGGNGGSGGNGGPIFASPISISLEKVRHEILVGEGGSGGSGGSSANGNKHGYSGSRGAQGVLNITNEDCLTQVPADEETDEN